MARIVRCIKLGREAEGLDFPPYPGELGKKTWVDLRELSEDYDKREFDKCIKNTILTCVHSIPVDILCLALGCAAYAPDTTRKQKDYIMNARAVLGCA